MLAARATKLTPEVKRLLKNDEKIDADITHQKFQKGKESKSYNYMSHQE